MRIYKVIDPREHKERSECVDDYFVFHYNLLTLEEMELLFLVSDKLMNELFFSKKTAIVRHYVTITIFLYYVLYFCFPSFMKIPKQMKIQIFLLTIIKCLCSIKCVYGQMYPVPEMEIDSHGIHEQFATVKVEPFSISDLITVGEFKTYLDAVKKDSTMAFYEAQLVSTARVSKELLNDILNDKNFQDIPMPGVSWFVAKNYCRWLTAKSKLNGLTIEYDLPFLSEMMAFQAVYSTQCNYFLESWTLNSYAEFYGTLPNSDFTYDALPNDPPAMKRKVIYGGSYHMNYVPSGLSYQKLHYGFQDSTSRYVGFRIVRRHDLNEPFNLSLNDTQIFGGFKNNRLNGVYHEKYANGTTKVLGCFESGQRIGVWSVFSQEGELIIQRNYQNNKIFDFVFPINKHVYSEIYEKHSQNKPQRNVSGEYIHNYVFESEVSYERRYWRVLNESNETELFEQVDFKELLKMLIDNKVIWYYHRSKSGTYFKQLEPEKLEKIYEGFNTWDFSRIEIHEDFFFSMETLMGDSRALSMSFYEKEADETPSFTIYFPQGRSVFAKFKLKISNLPMVENLDDYFFFNTHRGEVIKATEHNPNTKRTPLELDMEKYWVEHQLWMDYGR
jgi:antitoxin component YwqK of YwqJK toxin-antitoxin module